LGFKHDEALSLGKAVAGLTAQSKGQRLGIFKLTPKELKKVREQERGEEFRVELLGRALPAVNTDQGVRAVIKSKPIEPDGVERYLESKFGDALPKTRKAMTELANALNPDELAQKGFGLYEQFRPAIPEGVQGGCKGRTGSWPYLEAGSGSTVRHLLTSLVGRTNIARFTLGSTSEKIPA
jgi:hypothetical protein